MKFKPMRGLLVALENTRRDAVVEALRLAATEMRCDYDRQVLLDFAGRVERDEQ